MTKPEGRSSTSGDDQLRTVNTDVIAEQAERFFRERDEARAELAKEREIRQEAARDAAEWQYEAEAATAERDAAESKLRRVRDWAEATDYETTANEANAERAMCRTEVLALLDTEQSGGKDAAE